jgi:4-hydroxyphenylpyruvate dioxygenase
MSENATFNPCHLDGFAFLEFSGPNKQFLHKEFIEMGFEPVCKHKSADVTLYQQGHIQFIINAAGNNQAAEHATVHGPGACAMGFKVKDAQTAYNYALQHGATAFDDCDHANHHLFAINAIGGSVIYFVDDNHHPFQQDWIVQENVNKHTNNPGLINIDHLTHNVYRGNMDMWAKFYEDIFNFKEIRFFNIEGKITGLISRALASPCGKIKIPLNESKDDKSQIEEFLHEYKGEGIQHIALTTEDIYSTVTTLKSNGVSFLDVPDVYYEMIDNRIPWHSEPINELQPRKILIDGEQDPKYGLLLQIFTENIFGPVFFEIIQRKGNQGFGEGNFQALFEAIERDQIRRGTLEELD